MSDLSYEIDDDQIVDQQTMINVGNLIIDLESDIEKGALENEQTNPKTGGVTTSTSTHQPKVSNFAENSSGTGKNPRLSSKHSNNNNSNNNNLDNCVTEGRSNNSITTNNTSTSHNNNNGTSKRAVFKSSSDERGELKMRITRETRPGKSEHKIVTSPNQKSPTSSCGNLGGSTSTQSISDSTQESICINKKPSNSISSTKECGTSTSIGTITEPDCLGPCEPGTSVTLEGIVWQETEGGILVVNVTWRGKTYVGSLLDCTKHDWAPPRLCDSPASDIDSKSSKGVRPKRIVTRSNGMGLDEKNLLQTTGKLRNGKGRRIPAPNDSAPCNKRQRESEKSNESIPSQIESVNTGGNVSTITHSETEGVPINSDTPVTNDEPTKSITDNGPAEKAGPNSPMLIGCNEPNCSKKYRNANGLLYHQTHAHGGENEPNNAHDSECSGPPVEKQRTPVVESSELSPKQEDTTHTQNQSKGKVDEPPVTGDIRTSQKYEIRQATSPQISSKYMSSKIDFSSSNDALLSHESRSNLNKLPETERRDSHIGSRPSDKSRRTPPKHLSDFSPCPGLNSNININNTQLHQQSTNSITPINPLASRPITSKSSTSNHPISGPSDEGIKPSGTSTGPPPAPHQSNCYFNSPFLPGFPFPIPSSYYPRTALPPPLYDALNANSSSPNNIFSRYMGQIQARPPPPPESSSRLLSPSLPKNIPYPPFKPDPNALPIPVPHLGSQTLSNLPPQNPPPPPPPPGSLGSISPHLRLPSQVDTLLPPVTQQSLPPFLINPNLPLPPQMGALGRQPVPGMMDDPLGKQFPRRFN